MGAAPTREAESIVYRRKSFRKKNSSLASDEPRGSAAGGTTNDSIAPNGAMLISVYNAYGTKAVLVCRISIAVSVHPEDPARQTVREDAVTQFLRFVMPAVRDLFSPGE